MSEQQRQVLDGILRGGPLNLAADLTEQRQTFEKMTAAHPLPADVRTSLRELGGVPAITVEIGGTDPAGTVLYFHGGAYVMGSAQSSLGLAAEIARRAGVRVVTVDYRLAPENPYPAALDDALASYRALLSEAEPGQIALAGESAGGGLAIALLVADRDTGLPMPASAAVFSPFADLTLSGASIAGKSLVDPALTEAGLRLRGGQYIAAGDPAAPTASPVFASLKDLPSLLIQAGSHEILLDDALRLATRAAHDDVAVQLQVTPGVPHVFQAFAELLDEAGAALDEAGRFIAASVRR
jgi:monoterpene epsilon-lactone hydrolase